jgi:NAD(P)-dependent dehydrogenase (short-subunit alcohol dehydrogenase family)
MQYAKQGIRANSIALGLMNTPLIHQQIAGQYPSTEDMVRARAAMSPTGKMGDTWNIANAAVFLASDDAKFISSVVLRRWLAARVDGLNRDAVSARPQDRELS